MKNVKTMIEGKRLFELCKRILSLSEENVETIIKEKRKTRLFKRLSLRVKKKKNYNYHKGK